MGACVRKNSRISQYTKSSGPLIHMQQDNLTVTVDLNLLSQLYHAKFINSNFEPYCLSFINRFCVPAIQNFLRQNQLYTKSVNFQFKLNNQLYQKFSTITL